MENNITKLNINEKEKTEINWLFLKSLLRAKSILENSINTFQASSINKFASKFIEIYNYKILIQLLIQKNKKMILSYKKANKNKEIINEKKFEIKNNLKDLCPNDEQNIKNFFIYFRKNNSALIRLIKNISYEQRKELAEFLCHFFYNNFFDQSEEAKEILKIIYLLLEQELNGLYTPLCNNFLKNSFLSIFLTELGNSIEIRNYMDVILNNLIKDIEDKNSFNCHLNMITNSENHYRYYKEENQFFKMNNQDENFINYVNEKKKTKLEYIFSNIDKNKFKLKKRRSEIILYNPINNFPNKNNNNIMPTNSLKFFKGNDINDIINDLELKNYIHEDFFFNINAHYFKSLLVSEKNEIMQHFYIKQINKLYSYKNQNIFSCHEYYTRIKSKKILSVLAVEQFNKLVETITNFIDSLLLNLEKKEIMPYKIRVICKYINILISQKFIKLTKMQKNTLICNYLFGILIIPLLESPDILNSLGDMIISINTRNILCYISIVLKHLIQGELFNSKDNYFYTIFNNFIIKNFFRIDKIINKIINVKLPEENINIDKNYNNFNDKSFQDLIFKTSQGSICFNSNHFLLFYNTIHVNKNEIFKCDKYIENIFDKITEQISFMKFDMNNYYIITEENNENLLAIKEEDESRLKISNNQNKILDKIKQTIIYVLNKLNLILNIGKDISTIKTFEIITNYLEYYCKFNPKTVKSQKVPLYWYSKYIVNNLNLLNDEYKINDFELLYKEIKNNLELLLQKYIFINDNLTINTNIKLNLLEKKIQIYKAQYEKIKNNNLNIKSLIFIESNNINVCLMKGSEYNKYIRKDINKLVDNNILILSNTKNCIHNKNNISGNLRKYKYNFLLKKYHCSSIKEFAKKFSEFYNVISEEILEYSMGSEFYESKESMRITYNFRKKSKKMTEKISGENMIITYSIKNILENYMNNIKKKLKYENTDKQNKEKMINIIWNYILKSLYNPILINQPSFLDTAFKVRCLTLKNIVKPENLKIPKEIFDNNFFMKIINNIKIIDELRTPGEIFERFGIFIKDVNTLFKFFMNKGNVEPDELIQIIIYLLISSTPERIIFKTNFCKFFLGENELKDNVGINITQIEGCIMFINKLEANQIGLSQQEFNNYCSKINFSS